MKNHLMRVGAFVVGLAFAAPAAAQDEVIYYGKNAQSGKQAVMKATGTITEENQGRVVIKNSTGRSQDINAPDIIDIWYFANVRSDLRGSYRKAKNEEDAADNATATAAKVKALQSAITLYQDLLPRLTGSAFPQRHLQYKLAQLYLRLRDLDPANYSKKAVDALTRFKKDHPEGWQITKCLTTLANLQIGDKDFKGAAQTFETLAKMTTIPRDRRQQYELETIQALVKAKDFTEAESKANSLKRTLPKTDPFSALVDLQLVAIGGHKNPTGARKAEQDLLKFIETCKDKKQLAFAYNTLGDLYQANDRAMDAVWKYLYVDVIYDEDRTEHIKALTQLVILFKKLRREEYVKEFKEKLERLGR